MIIQTLVQRFCEYSTFIKGYSPETIRRYRTVTRFFARWAGITEIEEVSELAVRRYFLYGRSERGWSANTFINHHKTLVVFFRWCVKEGYLEQNPAQDIEVPKLEKRLPPKLTRQEAHRILETVANYPYAYRFLRIRNHAIFSTFVFAGLRKKELLSLKFADVDLENLSLFVRQGKGNKDRVVPICATLAESLSRYLTERKRLNKTCPEFFTSLNRNMGLTDIGLRRLVARIRVASGVSFHIHKLRHTFATLMLEGGCDIYSLSRMMGHSDIKTTTIYLAASAEHLRGQITKHPLNG